ncbi:MAG: FAD:protein FMN transferase [Christensenellales bacterium]
MKKYVVIITILLIASMLIGVGCTTKLTTPDGEDYTYYRQKSYTSIEFFGTATYLVLAGNTRDNQVVELMDTTWNKVKEALREIDEAISESVSGSDVDRFNRAEAGERVEVSKHTYDIVSLCKSIKATTGGKFDPTTARLVDLWGFSPRFVGNYQPTEAYDRADYKHTLPDDRYVEAFNSLVGVDKVELVQQDDRYYLVKPTDTVIVDDVQYTVTLSLGGIGKGYACDIAYKIIKESGFNFGYVNVGTSSLSLLKSTKPVYEDNSLAWRVGVVNPRGEGNYLSVKACDQGFSTSGDYERFYEIDGKRYCHIIGEDGYPIDGGIITASVVGESSAVCDALSTAICCMSVNEAMEFVQGLDYNAYFVFEQGGKYRVYSNSPDTMTINGGDFVFYEQD